MEQAEAEAMWRYKVKTEIDTQNEIKKAQAQAEIDVQSELMKAQGKAAIATQNEIEKAQAKAEIDIKKAEVRADIATKKELQTLELMVDESGELRAIQQLMHDTVRGRANVKIIASLKCCPADDLEDDGVLAIKVVKGNEPAYWVFIDLHGWKEAYVVDKLRNAGISFGLKKQKESELLFKVFLFAKDHAKLCYVPVKFGWNIVEGKKGPEYKFVYPEERIWGEVKGYANKATVEIPELFEGCV